MLDTIEAETAVPVEAHPQKSYDLIAEVYDVLEHGNDDGETPITTNMLLTRFASRGVRSVLDMTCGTGTQTIPLHKAGYHVVGTDLSEGMLEVARRKSRGLGIEYRRADMRDVSVGEFDAIISMFNSIGHLSYADFERTVRNAYRHLRSGGMYVFDIFDTDAVCEMQEYDFIDAVAVRNKRKYVRFSRCRFNSSNEHLEIEQKTYIQDPYVRPEIIEESYSLQTYRRRQLRKILDDNGFSEVTITGDGLLDVFGVPGLCHFAVCYKS